MNGLVLVVEDELNDRVLIKWIVEDAGLDTVLVETAREGLAELEKKNFDLILMDINLGLGMDGMEATSIIRVNPRTANIPVIAVTSYSAEEAIESIYASGVDEVVSKPIDRELLVKRIKALIHRPS